MLLQSSKLVEHALEIYHSIEPGKDALFPEGVWNKMPFFTMELYGHTRNPKILADLTDELERIGQYQAASNPGQYRLYYGKSGLAFLYLELFRITREEGFLSKAKELGKDFLRSKTHAFKIYDSFGLADGLAGTLMFYLALYAETEQQWVFDYIEQCIPFFIDKANLTQSGVFWNGSRKSSRVAAWDQGGSGISFCFLELAGYFNNKDLYTVAANTLKEEDVFLRGKGEDHRTAEFVLVRLYASLLMDDGRYPADWEEWAARGADTLPVYELANRGLAFKEAYSLTQNINYLDSAFETASGLVERLTRESVIQKRKHLVKGSGYSCEMAGIGYSLLKIAAPDSLPSLLLPRLEGGPATGNIDNCRKAQENTEHARHADLHRLTISQSQKRTNSQLLKKNFKKTFLLVEKAYPEELAFFLSSQPFISPQSVEEWVSGLPKDRVSEELVNDLREGLEVEMIIIRLRGNPEKFLLGDPLEFAVEMEWFIQLPDEDFMKLRLVLSDKVFVLYKEPSVDFAKPFTPDLVSELFTTYGTRSFYFWGDEFTDFKIERMGTSRILADRFAKPTPVHVILNQITTFIFSLGDQQVAFLVEKFMVRDKNHLRAQLNYLMLSYMRTMLMKCVLVVASV